MLITELLYEMPMHHNDLSSHELNTPDGNHTYYRKYIKGAKLVNELSPAIGIYHSNRRYPTYLVLDKSTERVICYLHFSIFVRFFADCNIAKHFYQGVVAFVFITRPIHDFTIQSCLGHIHIHHSHQLMEFR